MVRFASGVPAVNASRRVIVRSKIVPICPDNIVVVVVVGIWYFRNSQRASGNFYRRAGLIFRDFIVAPGGGAVGT